MSKILAAVEVGTSSAKALIGELTDAKGLNVVAASSVPNEGVRKGQVVDYRKAAAAVHAALEEAEKAARLASLSSAVALVSARMTGAIELGQKRQLEMKLPVRHQRGFRSAQLPNIM